MTSKLYSAPRKFDLATIMVVTMAFAGVLGLLKFVGLPPEGMAATAGFIAVVAASQAVLFGGKWPRAASILAGVAYVWCVYLFILLAHGGGFPVLAFAVLAVFGALSGYFVGVSVGAVFLVTDIVRRTLFRRSSRPVQGKDGTDDGNPFGGQKPSDR